MDLPQATGTPEPVTISGHEYQVRLLNMKEWASEKVKIALTDDIVIYSVVPYHKTT